MTQKQNSIPVDGKSMLPKQLTIVTNGKFCNVWGRKSAENIQNDSGTWTGWFTMIVYRHTAVLVQHCVAPKTWVWSRHLPYWAELAPRDFLWFLRMELLLWWHCLQDAHDIQEQLMIIYTWFQKVGSIGASSKWQNAAPIKQTWMSCL